MKTYLKDLSPEEVIRRLKAGEVVKCEKTNFVYKVIDDLPCIIYDDGEVVYNASLTICKNGPFYFDTPTNSSLKSENATARETEERLLFLVKYLMMNFLF